MCVARIPPPIAHSQGKVLIAHHSEFPMFLSNSQLLSVMSAIDESDGLVCGMNKIALRAILTELHALRELTPCDKQKIDLVAAITTQQAMKNCADILLNIPDDVLESIEPRAALTMAANAIQELADNAMSGTTEGRA